MGLGGDVLVEPAVDQHVADGGAHGHQVETEEREVVIPGGGLGGENIISYLHLSLDKSECQSVFYNNTFLFVIHR